MIKYLIVISINVLLLFSCKKINLKTIENNEIKIEQFDISTITTSHVFLELTNKRWDKTETIYEGNSGTIDSVFIKKDTIFIVSNYSDRVIFDLSAKKFGYVIVKIKR